jgi:tRNA (adenine37-N6)-methyltransferase
MDLITVGVVRSSVVETEQMPLGGVAAQVEILPEYAEGLLGIGSNTHVIVIGWLDKADRSKLKVQGRRRTPNGELRGVFGLRSAQRPNPIAITPAKLLKVERTTLYLDRLDLVDGTPVVDVKRYSPGWDCIFSARTSSSFAFPAGKKTIEVLEDLYAEATAFHGERCVDAAKAVKAVYMAMQTWQVGPKDRELQIWVGRDLCIADALQGITGATLGNGRLKVPGGRKFRIVYRNMSIGFIPLPVQEEDPAEVFWYDPEQLFRISADTVEPVTAEAPARKGTDPDLYDTLVQKVNNSLINGQLPCAVAHKMAEEMSIYVGEIGKITDAVGVKISRCQLGCFR